MTATLRHLYIPLVLAAIVAGCSSRPAQAPAPQAAPVMASPAPDYVAPQSAPVLPPTYPPLGGPVVQYGSGAVPLVQGN